MYRLQPEKPDVSGFRRFARGSTALFVPEQVINALEKEAEARLAAREAAEAAAAEPAVGPAPPEALNSKDFEPFSPATYSVKTFSEAAIQRAIEESKRQDGESRSRIKVSIAAAQRSNGCRMLPEIEPDLIEGLVTTLRQRFPNFRNVIDHLQTDLSLGMASTPETFRLEPILLYGSPGIGKTAFSMALAQMLGVGFDRICAAGLQGAFELVGSSSHWSNSAPGKVFNLIAGGDYASPVLVIDEIDKIASDERYPVIPALLELLEPVSARDLMDQSISLRFDASKIIVITTANSLDAIAGPLLSRLRAIEVLAPTEEERRSIAETIFREIVKGLLIDLRILDDALDCIAKASIDIRALARLLRDAIGRVIRERKKVVGAGDLHMNLNPPHARIGFV